MLILLTPQGIGSFTDGAQGVQPEPALRQLMQSAAQQSPRRAAPQRLVPQAPDKRWQALHARLARSPKRPAGAEIPRIPAPACAGRKETTDELESAAGADQRYRPEPVLVVGRMLRAVAGGI